MTDAGTDASTITELERIRSAYEERDSGPPGPYSYARPGYQFYIQQLEWNALAALRDAGVDYLGADVLEVGCGSGYFLHRFVEFGGSRAAGIDLVEARIDEARRRYPNLELIAGDAGALPWDDASFDLVIQFTCISSVLDPELRARIASEMWRVLRPGGAVLSYDMRPAPFVFRQLQRLRAFGKRGDPQGTPIRPVSVEELRAWFPAAGLTTRTTSLHFDLCGIARRGRLAASLLDSLPFLRSHLLGVARKASG
jgi:SAM-dependent methyltransferase